MTLREEVIFFDNLRRADVALVGGKNSSLGEMVQELGAKGILVPPGFATTSDAFRTYIETNNLGDTIAGFLADHQTGKISLHSAAESIRAAIIAGDWPASTEAAIRKAYKELSKRAGQSDVSVAVQSSATAEEDASEEPDLRWSKLQ